MVLTSFRLTVAAAGRYVKGRDTSQRLAVEKRREGATNPLDIWEPYPIPSSLLLLRSFRDITDITIKCFHHLFYDYYSC